LWLICTIDAHFCRACLKTYIKKEDEASENCNVVITSWRKGNLFVWRHPETDEIRNQWLRKVQKVNEENVYSGSTISLSRILFVRK